VSHNKVYCTSLRSLLFAAADMTYDSTALKYGLFCAA